MHEIRNGDRVRFVDVGNVVTGDAIQTIGTCNGEPIDTTDGARYWPIFTARDNGREATTLYVHESNIIGAVKS